MALAASSSRAPRAPAHSIYGSAIEKECQSKRKQEAVHSIDHESIHDEYDPQNAHEHRRYVSGDARVSLMDVEQRSSIRPLGIAIAGMSCGEPTERETGLKMALLLLILNHGVCRHRIPFPQARRQNQTTRRADRPVEDQLTTVRLCRRAIAAM